MKGASMKRTPVDWALQFLWNKPEVSCVLSGMGNQRMVEENCKSADGSGINSLSKEEVVIIEKLANIYKNKILVPCTACRYCMPCPSGVNIPKNKSLGSSGGFNSRIIQWLITRRYRQLASNNKQLAKKPNNGNASICVKCNQCVPKCPQKIDIPGELENVNAIFSKNKKLSDIYPN